MASNKDAAGFDLTVDFNRVNLALAKRQSMLASLMGLSSAAEHPDTSIPGEALDNFTAEPELLGIGAKKGEDDKDVSQILSSEIRLKRQLLTKNSDKQQAATRLPLHGQKGGLVGGPTPKGRAPPVEKRRQEDVESDEDAGRSSLGKRKRAKKEHAKRISFEGVNGEKKEEVPQKSSNVQYVDNSAFMEQKDQKRKDYASSGATEKKRKKKNKKKNQKKTQEELPAS